jgi:hypothetical protein
MNAKKLDGCSCSAAPRKAFLEQNTPATSFSFESGFVADCTIIMGLIVSIPFLLNVEESDTNIELNLYEFTCNLFALNL